MDDNNAYYWRSSTHGPGPQAGESLAAEGKIKFATCAKSVYVPASYLLALLRKEYDTSREPANLQAALLYWLLSEISLKFCLIIEVGYACACTNVLAKPQTIRIPGRGRHETSCPHPKGGLLPRVSVR